MTPTKQSYGLEVFPNVLSEQDTNQIITLFTHDDNAKVAGFNGVVKPKEKKSTDLHCNFKHREHDQYNVIIFPAVRNMIDKMTELYSDQLFNTDYWEITPWYNIQHYKDGEGFSAMHNEQSYLYATRMLAWMIYLNDSPCGTEFPYQNTTLEAKQGHGAVWAAAWTHTHKGVTPNIGNKYIATGWCRYHDRDNVFDCHHNH